MVGHQDDEETPLVQRPQQVPTTAKTPLPWDQFWVVLLLQVSEPFALQTLSPFTPQLIRDIGVTHGDESLVGHYAGVMQSSYFAAQALTVLYWSQLSDHIGRKPVLLISLFAISVSMFSFGCSKTFVGLVISRFICGAFNGSNGIVKSVVMEITDATNLPAAYGYMPLPFMLGNMVGPVVGGSFSRPADRFPEIFGRSELLKTYPYLLPCAVPAIFSAVAWFVTYFRLREVGEVLDSFKLYLKCSDKSVPTTTPFWRLIKNHFFYGSFAKPSISERLSDVSTTFGEEISEIAPKPLPLRSMLTPKVLSVTVCYATMALFHVSLISILPVFYATPIELGGLSLDPPRIGAILAASSLTSGVFQLLFNARLHDRFGAKAVYTTGVLSGIPIIISFPAINSLARAHGLGLAVWLVIGVEHALAISLVICYPCLVLFIKAAAPNRASLGATNGIAQLVVAGARIVGPASVSSVFSYSIQEGHDAWLVYYFLMAIVFLAVGFSMLLPRDPSLWEDHK